MSSPSSAVQALLATVRYPARATPVDWEAVERAVGLRYPAEFRQIAEAMPPGSFQTFLNVLHPAEFDAEEYADEVAGYREMVEDGDVPVPGRVLPWAIVGFDFTICWLVDGDDPDRWPIAVGGAHGNDEWEIHRLSTAEFLRAVVTEPSPSALLEHVAAYRQPPEFFGNDGSQSAAAPGAPDEAYWNGAAEGRELTGPADCVEQLRGLITPDPIVTARWYDEWSKLQGRLDYPPPEDYRRLVEEFGNVRIGPVTVAAPGGRLDFLASYQKVLRRVREERKAGGGPPGTVWPEPRGVLHWADIDGGGMVCWLPVAPHWRHWPVIVLDAGMRHGAVHLMSTTRFLLELATDADFRAAVGGRP